MVVLSESASSKLGPQCLKCRKRRVKCDSAAPTCRRCQDAGFECPGYRKQLKWVAYNKSTPFDIPRYNIQCESPASTVTSKSSTTTIHPFPQDSHELVMMDSIRNYNSYVLPFRSPQQKPFNRQRIFEGIPWQVLPRVIRFIFIATIRTLQAARNDLDPSLQTDVCLYRGLSLGELKEHIDGAEEDLGAIALGSVLLLIGADMHIPNDSSWLVHLHAAARIITLRGGLEACIQHLPSLRAPLGNYVVIDILTATTCNKDLLFSDHPASVKQHQDLIALIPNLERDFIANSTLCPSSILEAIVRTNILRGNTSTKTTNESQCLFLESPPDVRTTSKEFNEIVEAIDNFNANQWATTICRFGKPLPEPPNDVPSSADTQAFTSLGQSYQSAALIYLILSCQSTKAKQWHNALLCAKTRIDEEAAYLFSVSSPNNDGPSHEQLWKFLTWPMVISVYARVGWHIGSSSRQNNSLEMEFDGLKARAKQLRSRNLGVAVEHMRKIAALREFSTAKAWTWDDGFPGRYAFAV